MIKSVQFLFFLFILTSIYLLHAATAFPTSNDDNQDYPVPQPIPVNSAYLIGTFTCNFWYSDKGFPYHTWIMGGIRCTYWPLLGKYYSGDPYAWDWQIKWASEHGINFFIFYWYWRDDSSEPWMSFRDNLIKGFLSARYINYTKFALCISTEAYGNRPTQENLVDCVDDMCHNYLSHSSYLKINNKPIVFMINTGSLIENYNVEWVIDSITNMREDAMVNGYNLTLINAGMGNYDNKQYNISKAFDGCAFADGWAGAFYKPFLSYNTEGKPIMTAPYELMVDGWLSIANIWSNLLGHRYVPSIMPAPNNSGWYSCPSKTGFENWLCIRTNGTQREFERLCEGMKKYADYRADKMILVWSWDEFGEGASIQPSKEYGFSRLDAIRNTYVNCNRSHTDQCPVICPVGNVEYISWDDQNKRLDVEISGFNGESTNIAIISGACPVNLMIQGIRIPGEDLYNGTHIIAPITFKNKMEEVTLI